MIDKNESEFILNKPKILVKVIGEMSKVERLIYNYFLTLITTTTTKRDEKGYYYTTLASIKNITKINDYKLLEKNLINLQHTSLHINILEEKTFVSLIGEIKIFNNYEVRLFFTPTIVELAEHKNPNYAKIDLRLLAKLNSKYSLIIYELIKTYYNKNNSRITIPHLTILEFRELMGIVGKLKTNQHLKDTVLEKAKVDIFEKTDFNFDYEFLKKNKSSKKFTHIRLSFIKKCNVKEEIIEETEIQKLTRLLLESQKENKESQKQKQQLTYENKSLEYKNSQLTNVKYYNKSDKEIISLNEMIVD